MKIDVRPADDLLQLKTNLIESDVDGTFNELTKSLVSLMKSSTFNLSLILIWNLDKHKSGTSQNYTSSLFASDLVEQHAATTAIFINKQKPLQKHCPQLARLFEAGRCVKNENKTKAN